MNNKVFKTILGITIFITGIIVTWSGMIYAYINMSKFCLIGIIIGCIGYFLSLSGLLLYETIPED